MDDKEHWNLEELDRKGCIRKEFRDVGQLNGLGTSNWGISANSWRAAYTGMIKAIALWGAELGWRGWRDWEEEFKKLQSRPSKSA